MEGGMGEDAPGSCGYPQMDDLLSAKRAKLDASEDRLLNFATAADEFELSLKRQKIPRDPMSHRIIEKRRRDRMNNCLADLSRLIPASYHKQGQGRIEKTEIIEMAIKHINLLQQRVDELEKKVNNPEESKVQTTPTLVTPKIITPDCSSSKFYMGFKDAQDEVMRFLVEVESINTMDPFCKKIMKHLENASQKFVVKEQKTELSPMDSESGSQPPMFSHHHSAFYSTQGRGSGGEGGGGDGERGTGGLGEPSLPDDGVLGGGDVDTKSQDDRLRYLLGEQPSSMVGRVMTGSGPPDTTEDRRGSLPMFSYSSHLSATGSVVGSSGYISDTSNMDKNSPSGSTSSRDHVYKFKHNITKRFSQEGRHHRYSHHHHHIPSHHHHRNHQHTTSDSSSNTSSRDLEDDQGQLRWKGSGGGGNSGGGGKHHHHHKSSGSSSAGGGSSLFTDDLIGADNNSPNSDEGNSGSNSGNSSSTTATSARSHHHHHHRGYNNNNNNNNSNNNNSNSNNNGGEGKNGQMGSCGSIECHNNASSLSLSSSSSSSATACQSSSMSSVALPGFILHPTGTHYMPISVHNSNMSGLFESSGDQEGMPVFHPISIPVHFRRPVISMPNITICTHNSSKQKDRSIKE